MRERAELYGGVLTAAARPPVPSASLIAAASSYSSAGWSGRRGGRCEAAEQVPPALGGARRSVTRRSLVVSITAAAGTLDFAATFGRPTDCHYLESGCKVHDELAGALRQLRRGTRPRKLESQTLDFKAPSRTPKVTFANLTDAAVCFANSAGGVIGPRHRRRSQTDFDIRVRASASASTSVPAAFQ
jgi:hypothetical protein